MWFGVGRVRRCRCGVEFCSGTRRIAAKWAFLLPRIFQSWVALDSCVKVDHVDGSAMGRLWSDALGTPEFRKCQC